MMDYRWTLFLIAVVGLVSSQKLYFKSNTILQKEVGQHVSDQVKTEPATGFGFKEPRQYFTDDRKNQEMAPKVPAGVVVCPDRTSACPDGNTCCMTSTGAYGCCPLPMLLFVVGLLCKCVALRLCLWCSMLPRNLPLPIILYARLLLNLAVCCSDHVHCCPHRTTCDVSSGKCDRGDSQLDWFVKKPAIEIGNVKCDSTHECPPRNTCCKQSSGQWGCCPLPQAVCCSDRVHCCPHGTTCDVSSGKCDRGDSQLDWFVKKPAIEIGDVKCDSTHKCPSGETCCKQSSGQWGCCPLPQTEYLDNSMP